MSTLRTCIALAALLVGLATAAADEPLEAGFAAIEITPPLDAGKRVYLAGFGTNRRARGVHDALYARTVVLQHGQQRLAIVSVDLVGLQYPAVKAIRSRLPEFTYVLVSSTHNHHGPDVIGIWGKGWLHRGADNDYIAWVGERIVESVRQAARALKPVTAVFGTAEDESLLTDTRLPITKDGVLRAVRLNQVGSDQAAGLIVQWNCHPESWGPRNALVSADFPAATIAALEKSHRCPVVYISGAVGGLMTNPPRLVGPSGDDVHEGAPEFTELYGRTVASLTNKALARGQPVKLTPLAVYPETIAVPVHNSLYRAARAIGVMQREAFVWTGDFRALGDPMTERVADQDSAIESEVAYVRLGELHVACIPGELYPELVYGKFENPPAAGVDFPDARLEPTIAELMPSKNWLLVGLANDELGYIIPKRQWDKAPPYAYDKDGGQYGEINSCSPEVAPIVMQALQQVIEQARKPSAAP